MQKRKLLIIDDEERLRNLLARILQLEGYDVLVASTGKEGLKKHWAEHNQLSIDGRPTKIFSESA